MKKYLILLIGFLFYQSSTTVSAQQLDTLSIDQTLDFRSYLQQVTENNLAYAAERFNMAIVKANILSAKISPDPELNLGFSDHSDKRVGMGYGFSSELAWVFELGGKRRLRVEIAEQESEISSYLFQDFFENLRAYATVSYLEAILYGQLLTVQTESFQQLRTLAQADSIRYRLGEIAKINAQQTRLESDRMRNEVYQAEAEFKAALVNLPPIIGEEQTGNLLAPRESMERLNLERAFILGDLIQYAISNRSILKATEGKMKQDGSSIKLAKANRSIDLGLSVAVDHNTMARNAIAPTPAFTTFSGGITIPIKYSNRYPGERAAAEQRIKRTEQELKHIGLEIQAEVSQAFHKYEASKKQVVHFRANLLLEANSILEAKVYQYQRGDSSLLDVLDAQRTLIDVRREYYQAICRLGKTLVELERVVGIWDIDFYEDL
ncbi:MAG: TolC family protein [Sphingobacterium sp.]